MADRKLGWHPVSELPETKEIDDYRGCEVSDQLLLLVEGTYAFGKCYVYNKPRKNIKWIAFGFPVAIKTTHWSYLIKPVADKQH